ncbi:hypothetical protein [Bombiscardovia coagulans]|uniref:Bacterial Ig-like domain (Group 3) n=1 Tax=Bombiscardovia coagulans TaxID=686666 RepID=A0A261EUQ8_9BIFI|nr:hypothetical protein [Bombiscardovia coagulans]OZG50598.1 Bacterial Ig-like domain (group 3) [Bombiscardovia coagulans]
MLFKSNKHHRVSAQLLHVVVLFAFSLGLYLVLQMLYPQLATAEERSPIEVSFTYHQEKAKDDITDGYTWVAAGSRSLELSVQGKLLNDNSSRRSDISITDITIEGGQPCPVMDASSARDISEGKYKLRFAGDDQDYRQSEYKMDQCRLKILYKHRTNNLGNPHLIQERSFVSPLNQIDMNTVNAQGQSVDFVKNPSSIIIDTTADRNVRLWVSGPAQEDPLGRVFGKASAYQLSLSSRDPWLAQIVQVVRNNQIRTNPGQSFHAMTFDQQPAQDPGRDPNHQNPLSINCTSSSNYTSTNRDSASSGDHARTWTVLNQSCAVNFASVYPYNSNARYTAKVQEDLARFLDVQEPVNGDNPLSFVYDTQQPTVTSVTYLSHEREMNSLDYDVQAGNTKFAFNKRSVRIRAKDMRPAMPTVDSNGNQTYPLEDGNDGNSDSNVSDLDAIVLSGVRYQHVDESGNFTDPKQLIQCPSEAPLSSNDSCDYSIAKGSDGNGIYFDVSFQSSGYYDFSQVNAQAVDRAGNKCDFHTLNSAAASPNSPPNTSHMISKLVIDTSYTTIGQPRIAVSRNTQERPIAVPQGSNGLDRYYFDSDVYVTVQSKDQYFMYYLRMLANDPQQNAGMLKYWRDDVPIGMSNSKIACPIDIQAIHVQQGEEWPWSLACNASVMQMENNGQGSVNGAFTFSFNDNLLPTVFSSQKTRFGIDTQAPAFTGFKGLRGSGLQQINDFPLADGKHAIVTSPGENKMQVRVQDLLPEEQRGAEEINGSSQNGSSGIGGECNRSVCHPEVRVEIPAPTDLNGNPLGKAGRKNLSLPVDESGWVTIDFNAEGMYNLSMITIEVRDRADHPSEFGEHTNTGNSRTIQLIDVVNKYHAKDGIEQPFDAVVIDSSHSRREAHIAVKQGNLNPSSTNPAYYFRGEAVVDFTITDRWFPLYQQLGQSNHDNFLTASVSLATPKPFEPVSFQSDMWKPDNTTPDTWVYHGYLMPRSDVDPQRPLEGKYQLKISYTGLQSDNTNVAEASQEFVIDYTGPTLGGLHLSAHSPQRWQWIFPSSLHVSLDGIGDSISQVDESSLDFKDYSQDDEIPMLSYDQRLVRDGVSRLKSSLRFESNSVVSFELNGDSQRLRFDATSIALKDKAGNPSSTHAISAYGNDTAGVINDAKGLIGVAIDSKEPVLTVTYDNNDVRNGKYFKAKRVAKVSLDESNFDFISGNDSKRTILTSSIDGRETELHAKDFANPSGDQHSYEAYLTCDADGDWVVDASVTDPGNHQAQQYHTEFTVDTTKPVMLITFDNNDSKNGMYYKAPRTATVTLVERNYSEKESVITTTAKNDANKDVPAPVGMGWSMTGNVKEYSWVQKVPFSGEYHYTLEANATDLAGNVAEVVKEPEFVIDMTKPDLHIEKVEDKSAYAGTVAPQIKFLDDNIDHGRTTYELVGDRRGKIAITEMEAVEGGNDNSVVIDIPDFQRKSSVDDVYTLTAKSEDMAGNSSVVSKTFSVNRFGSTYRFLSGTSSLRGAYLKRPQPVTVEEINVSGIADGQSKLEMAKNGRMHVMDHSEYQITKGKDHGWSTTTYAIPATSFTEDGYYRLIFTSTDDAGNLSENTMQNKNEDRTGEASVNFAIDSVPPTVSALGIDSHRVYYAQKKSVGVDVKDNMKIRAAQVFVDGVQQEQWSGDDLLKGVPSFELQSDAHSHKIVIQTEDVAGNSSTSTYYVVVASNWLQYVRENGVLFVSLIFTGSLLLLMLAVVITLLVRRRKALAYRRNPFGK